MLPRCLLALVVCGITHSTFGQSGEGSSPAPRLYAGASFFSDNDDFSARRVSLGAATEFTDLLHFTGARASHAWYSRGDWSASSNAIQLFKSALSGPRVLGFQGALGLSRLSTDHQMVTADLGQSFALGETTSAEVFYSRDWVETKNALSDGTSFNYYGAALTQQVTRRLTLIGVAAEHHFSDDNDRTHLRLKAVYDLFPDNGVNVQFSHRQFRNSSDISTHYFNPSKYREEMINLGYRGRVDGWLLSGAAGVGRQFVAQDAGRATELFEFEVRTPARSGVQGVANLSSGNSASISGERYRYNLLQFSVFVPF